MINVTSASPTSSPFIPDIIFYFHQLLFTTYTTMIVVRGPLSVAGLSRLLYLAFVETIVYCLIACWTWNPNGWLYELPSLDFAGAALFTSPLGRLR
jgi:ammonium transporter, Amt family